MLPYAVSLVCFAVGLMIGSSFGFTAELTLTSSPQEIQMVETKTLELKCDIVEVADSTPTSDSVMKNANDVNAIAILDANNEGVVSVLKGGGDPIIRYKDFKEKGAIANASLSRTGWLHLSVPYPDISNSGTYKCIGTVYDINENSQRISEDTIVTYKPADIEHLALHFNDMAKKLNKAQETIKGQKMEIEEQAKQLNKTQEIIKTEIEEQNTIIRQQTHLETGTVICGRSDEWNDGDITITQGNNVYTFKTRSKPVTFTHRYPTHPVVSVAVQDGQWLAGRSAWIRVDATYVTRSSFKVRCAIYKDAGRIYQLRVRWTVFPAGI